jgi:hypothetical protein
MSVHGGRSQYREAFPKYNGSLKKTIGELPIISEAFTVIIEKLPQYSDASPKIGENLSSSFRSFYCSKSDSISANWAMAATIPASLFELRSPRS